MQTLIRVIPEKEPEHAEFYVHCKDQACTAELLVLSWCSRVGLVLYFPVLPVFSGSANPSFHPGHVFDQYRSASAAVGSGVPISEICC